VFSGRKIKRVWGNLFQTKAADTKKKTIPNEWRASTGEKLTGAQTDTGVVLTQIQPPWGKKIVAGSKTGPVTQNS